MIERKAESGKGGSARKPVTFFKTQEDFRAWLETHHETETELIVGFYKVDSGKSSMNWSQSVDQALCFGWIDGVRRSIDRESYCIRFTPRRSTSNWSSVNIKKMEELTRAGQMTPAGRKAYEARKESRSGIYSYENEAVCLDPVLEKRFRENRTAWEFFTKQAPSYQKVIIRWIMSARQEKTRQSRLERTMTESEQQKRVT